MGKPAEGKIEDKRPGKIGGIKQQMKADEKVDDGR